MAKRHGLAIGDDVEFMGRAFTVVGTSTDAFMASFVFMSHAATDQLLRSPATTSFVLVGTDYPTAVRARLASSGFSVLDRDQLARADLKLMARAYSVPLTVMRWDLQRTSTCTAGARRASRSSTRPSTGACSRRSAS
jgi:putative ABC transport system permease protein